MSLNEFPPTEQPPPSCDPAEVMTIRATCHADILAAIPYLLGFAPQSGDAVCVGLHEGRVIACGRADLNLIPEATVTELLVAVHAMGTADAVIIVGYGAAGYTPAIAEAALTVREAGYYLAQVLRLDGDRFFCLLCEDCLPPGGEPFDPSETAAAASWTLAGRVALPSRAALLARVAHDPVAAAPMSPALNVAANVLLADPPDDARAMTMIDQMCAQAHAGRRLDDTAAATLILLLLNGSWRDYAWLATDDQPWLSDLWCDLARRCPDGDDLVAAPAALAGWSAWRCGNTVLAAAAVDRALAARPKYRMAQLLAETLHAHIPASGFPWPPTDSHDQMPTVAAQVSEPGR